MEYQYLLVEKQDGVLLITINREDKMNALNRALLQELKAAVQELHNDSSLKGAVITGKGEKAFAAGADIAEFTALSQEDARKMAQEGHDIFFSIEQCPKPVIAAVNGFALGGGCELAMACHIRIAGETAKFGQPEVNLGIIPGYGGTQRVAQLVGKGKAFELLMTGKMINAAEAYRIGLVNQLGHNDSLVDDAVAIIETIATKAPVAIEKVIKSINANFQDGVNGYQIEVEEFAACTATADFKEGATAFLEKRKANFTGK
ncbi:MAG: enoyl-CoA hydratase-related protein [Chitinophagales bacterium]|nr:enoyl-CoA hydratase-related protein [Chitinophagales bacterium]